MIQVMPVTTAEVAAFVGDIEQAALATGIDRRHAGDRALHQAAVPHQAEPTGPLGHQQVAAGQEGCLGGFDEQPEGHDHPAGQQARQQGEYRQVHVGVGIGQAIGQPFLDTMPALADGVRAAHCGHYAKASAGLGVVRESGGPVFRVHLALGFKEQGLGAR